MAKTLLDLAELDRRSGFREDLRSLSVEPQVVYMRNYNGCEGSCEGVGSDYGGGCDRSGGCDNKDDD